MPRIHPVSLAGTPGLCLADSKCVKKHGHTGRCWPSSKPARAKTK